MRLAYAIAVLSLICAPALAGSVTIDFGDLPAGSFVTDQYKLTKGVTIRAETKSGGAKTATIFNSNPPNPSPADPDLHSPMIGGNLVNQSLGHILIIAENTVDSDGNGLIDSPDDEARGGSLFFTFDQRITEFGFWVADIDSSQGEVSGSYFATVYSNGTAYASVNFDEFIDPTSPFYISDVAFDGDRTANDLGTLTADDLWTHARLNSSLPRLHSFDAVEIRFHSSAGIPQISFTVVPLPAGAWAGLAFLGALGAIRTVRRRRRAAL